MHEESDHHETSAKKFKGVKASKGGAVSRAKREREQMNQHLWVREREGLRDWTRKNYHSKSPGPGSNLYNQHNSANQVQESVLVQSLFTASKQTSENHQGSQPAVWDHIVFQSNGRDTYFKRAALRKGRKEGLWLENPISSSYFYTVKWDYGDSHFYYEKMKAHQFCNHFPDTRELTTKAGLTKNLNNLTIPGTDVWDFFPRSYDLSDARQLDLFIADFNQTSLLNIIQRHAEYFEQNIQFSNED